MSFRKNLKYLRKLKDISQEDLAHKLKVSRQSVSKWESGKAYPETEKILSICKIFDCSLDELMNDDIADIKENRESKYSLNDLLYKVTEFITKSIHMFDDMNARSKFLFILNMGVIFWGISLIHIPIYYIFELVSEVFANIPGNISSILISIWFLIFEIIYMIVASTLFVFIFKMKYLDKYKGDISVDGNDKETDTESNYIQKKDSKVKIIKYDFGIFFIFVESSVCINKNFYYAFGFANHFLAILFGSWNDNKHSVTI